MLILPWTSPKPPQPEGGPVTEKPGSVHDHL